MDIGKLFRDAWGLFSKDIGPLIVGMFIALIIPAIAGVIILIATLIPTFTHLHTDSEGQLHYVGSFNWILFGAGLVVLVIVAILLTVPLLAGLYSGVLRRVREGREMGYGDAFQGFSMFGRVVWTYALVFVLIPIGIIVVPEVILILGAVRGSGVVIFLGALLMVAAYVLLIYLLTSWAYVFIAVVDGKATSPLPAISESRRLVHDSGWWWTLLSLIIIAVVVGVVHGVVSLIPVVGAIAGIVVYPFYLTWHVAMYFQAQKQGEMIDAALDVSRPLPYSGQPAGSQPAAPYKPPAAPVMPPPPATAPVPPASPGAAAPPVAAGSAPLPEEPGEAPTQVTEAGEAPTQAGGGPVPPPPPPPRAPEPPPSPYGDH